MREYAFKKQNVTIFTNARDDVKSSFMFSYWLKLREIPCIVDMLYNFVSTKNPGTRINYGHSTRDGSEQSVYSILNRRLNESSMIRALNLCYFPVSMKTVTVVYAISGFAYGKYLHNLTYI